MAIPLLPSRDISTESRRRLTARTARKTSLLFRIAIEKIATDIKISTPRNE
jgi:hypothetical protein